MHRTVLIVEDDESILEAMRDGLEVQGYHVKTAIHGREALDHLATMDTPCLIFLDIMMPVMDGFQFRKHQLQDTRIAQIPVVVVTADGNASHKAASMGAQEGIRKPVEFEDLIRVTQLYCGTNPS
jgi:CheY-like chemotaxis protein